MQDSDNLIYSIIGQYDSACIYLHKQLSVYIKILTADVVISSAPYSTTTIEPVLIIPLWINSSLIGLFVNQIWLVVMVRLVFYLQISWYFIQLFLFYCKIWPR